MLYPLITLPLLSATCITGFLVLSLVSIITFSRCPVCSSDSSRKVIPSKTASNFATPPNSEIITALYGSHEQILSPRLILLPSFTYRYAPYGILLVTITLLVPCSTIRNSPERPSTTSTTPSSVLYST